jgi:hypothetical protein
LEGTLSDFSTTLGELDKAYQGDGENVGLIKSTGAASGGLGKVGSAATDTETDVSNLGGAASTTDGNLDNLGGAAGKVTDAFGENKTSGLRNAITTTDDDLVNFGGAATDADGALSDDEGFT